MVLKRKGLQGRTGHTVNMHIFNSSSQRGFSTTIYNNKLKFKKINMTSIHKLIKLMKANGNKIKGYN